MILSMKDATEDLCTLPLLGYRTMEVLSHGKIIHTRDHNKLANSTLLKPLSKSLDTKMLLLEIWLMLFIMKDHFLLLSTLESPFNFIMEVFLILNYVPLMLTMLFWLLDMEQLTEQIIGTLRILGESFGELEDISK